MPWWGWLIAGVFGPSVIVAFVSLVAVLAKYPYGGKVKHCKCCGRARKEDVR